MAIRQIERGETIRFHLDARVKDLDMEFRQFTPHLQGLVRRVFDQKGKPDYLVIDIIRQADTTYKIKVIHVIPQRNELLDILAVELTRH